MGWKIWCHFAMFLLKLELLNSWKSLQQLTIVFSTPYTFVYDDCLGSEHLLLLYRRYSLCCSFVIVLLFSLMDKRGWKKGKYKLIEFVKGKRNVFSGRWGAQPEFLRPFPNSCSNRRTWGSPLTGEKPTKPNTSHMSIIHNGVLLAVVGNDPG